MSAQYTISPVPAYGGLQMNNTMPTVSIIMPIYKRRFLKQSIDSVLAQTCRDFELVMVDDKSPENLYEVIKEYPWEKDYAVLPDGGRKWIVDGISVRYYQNEEDIGEKDLVAAWNHAMEYATGEWCVLASDDDLYDPGYLQEMLRLHDKYPMCDLFHSRIAIIDAEGKWTRVGEERIEFETQVQMAYSRGVRRLEQRAPDFMFRKSTLDAMGGFVNFPLAWYSDDATWMALSRHGCACSPQILFLFRQSGINISSVYGKSVERKLQAASMFKTWFRDFIETAVAASDEDGCLIQGMAGRVAEAVDNHTIRIIGNVQAFGEWAHLVRKAPLSKSAKRACVYARFQWLRALRMLWPF